jgi:hypothetical protein
MALFLQHNMKQHDGCVFFIQIALGCNTTHRASVEVSGPAAGTSAKRYAHVRERANRGTACT